MIKAKLSKQLLWAVVGVGLTASISVFALTEEQLEAIHERIAPVGQVCMQGDASCGAAVAAAGGGARSGQDVYDASCMACHGTGAAGAPKTGDAAAWAARMDKGLETLHEHAIEGFNAMPAKGLCMTCSDEEVIAAVDYILEQSQ